MSQTMLRQGSFTRTQGAPSNDPTFPRFHVEAILDQVATDREGRQIWRTEERVQIMQPGAYSQPVMRVTDEHRQRWPQQYEQFRRGEEIALDGIPLEQWPALKMASVKELKALDIHTVEQCAALSDAQLQRIRMGGMQIRELAKAYLDDSEAMAATTRALAAEQKAATENAELRRQNAELRTLMDQMHTRLMAVENAPSAVATYVPGEHGLSAGNQQIAPPAVESGSALSEMVTMRRRVGRPRKEDESA